MMRRSGCSARVLGLGLLVFVLAEAACGGCALAQAHNPFSVGISEGGGSATGLTGWLLAQQGWFERSIAGAVKASRSGSAAALGLIGGLSFAYGVLHAAGPGHGKAVLAAYMVANRQALRRGVGLSFLAALLQAVVAILLVSLLSYLFHVTAYGMREGAATIEKASYCGVALLGATLVWRKGRALVEAWRATPARTVRCSASDFTLGLAAEAPAATSRRYGFAAQPGFGMPAGATARFNCVAAHRHGPGCGHRHAPDPARLGEGFSWRDALSTIGAAGARPCSGAILVLVFAAAQSVFWVGIVSTLVMALGTALTTAALASTAVLARQTALWLGGRESWRGALAVRGIEFGAACLVLAVGLSLLAGVGPLQALS